MTALSQISPNDDFLFRLLLIPGGLVLLTIGVHAVRTQQLHLRKRSWTLQGTPAVLLGILVSILGIGCAVAAAVSFLS